MKLYTIINRLCKTFDVQTENFLMWKQMKNSFYEKVYDNTNKETAELQPTAAQHISNFAADTLNSKYWNETNG